MSPAFVVLGLMYLVSRKQRENYAKNSELQNEDAVSYIKGHSVSRIEKGINGAVLFAPLALALLWGKIIPESLTVPALCVAATVGFGVGALWERKLPKENKYHNWLN